MNGYMLYPLQKSLELWKQICQDQSRHRTYYDKDEITYKP